jgi:methylase of polypeptide subunit release factors
MVEISSSLKNFCFDSIPIDPFWNTSSEKELRIHRIHAYPAKFPAFITTKAINYYINTIGKTPNSIGDIFCGCGTTAFESRRNNIRFWGCDINPVATMIAKTKSRKYQSTRLNKYYNRIIELFHSSTTSNMYEYASERLQYWYDPQQFNNLRSLYNSIIKSTPSKSDYRLFFLCAFSNILKPSSKWLTKSIKPQVDPNKKMINIEEAFHRQFIQMYKANQELGNIGKANSEIITANFLDDKFQIPNIDMIITSPPYVTSYEYADLHQLSSLWLGYVDDYNFINEVKNLNSTGFSIVSLLGDQHKKKTKSVARYFLDMQKVAYKSYSILNENGIALFVIGNTTYKGVKIDNAKHLTEALLDAGFKDIKATKRKISNKILTPYRDKEGKFSSDGSGRKVYNEEFIIIGRKR